MNFTGIEYFLTLAKARSFTEAAARLHITQQALSAQIAALEAECGTRLVLRRVPIALTYAGEKFYDYARDVRNRTRFIRRVMEDVREETAGRLRIGIAPTRGRVLLPPILERFQTRYPRVAFRVEEAPNGELLRRLREGGMDLAIAAFGKVPTDLETEIFCRERVVLIVADALAERLYGNRKTETLSEAAGGNASALGGCPFLLNSRENIAGALARKWLAPLEEAEIFAEAGNMDTLLELGLRGCGAFFCPENLARSTYSEAELATLHLLPVAGGSYTISFGYRKADAGWSILRHFIEIAKQ